MIKEAHERLINIKLATATRGAHRPLDSIKIPTHKWFYFEQQIELYQYEQDNFKAHPQQQNTWLTHKKHTTHSKYSHPKTVTPGIESIQITGVVANPIHTWRDLQHHQKWRDYCLSKTDGNCKARATHTQCHYSDNRWE
jgi:hypothetical protein